MCYKLKFGPREIMHPSWKIRLTEVPKRNLWQSSEGGKAPRNQGKFEEEYEEL
jgi:hypothetical protein